MGNQQHYAKAGVFILLGINVAAYYFFWPRPNGAEVSQANAPRADNKQPALLVKQPNVVKPKEFPAASVRDAVPLPGPPSTQAAKPTSEPAEEALRKLLDHIAKEAPSGTEKPPPPSVPPGPKKDLVPIKPNDFGKKELVPAVPIYRENQTPRPLPRLKPDGVVIPSGVPKDLDNGKPATNKPVGVTSPLTAKTLPCAWQVNADEAGSRKVLKAKLEQGSPPRIVAEFLILCERIETDAKAGEVTAFGNVAFHGAGLHGNCQRLTVSTQNARVIFAQKAHVIQDAVRNVSLRGDRIEWEWNANSPGPRLNTSPGVLGAPK